MKVYKDHPLLLKSKGEVRKPKTLEAKLMLKNKKLARKRRLQIEKQWKALSAKLTKVQVQKLLSKSYPVIDTIYLSDRDWNQLIAILDNPPEPSEKLKQLLGN